MAENTANESNAATDGAHDRVVMLSLKADGTPDQFNPEIVGDPEFAREAAKRQFAEQAVSAADDARLSGAPDVEQVKQDPGIASTQKTHQRITTAAEKRADEVVSKLHKD